MTFEIIQNNWNNQASKKMSETEALEWVQKAKRNDKRNRLVLWAFLLIAIIHAPFRLVFLMETTRISAIDWVFECLFLAVLIIPCLFSMERLRKAERNRKLCHMRLVPMLHHHLTETDREIKEIKYHSPLLLIVFLVVFGIARWTAFETGYESQTKSIAFFGVIAAFVLICGAGLYHRLSAFLLPRKEYLNKLIEDLESVLEANE